MTYCFIQAIERGNGATYGSILTSMRATIRSTSNEMSGGPVTSLITMLLAGSSLGGGFRQVFALITLKHAVYGTPPHYFHPGLPCFNPYPLTNIL